jgi:hypothetical protein
MLCPCCHIDLLYLSYIDLYYQYLHWLKRVPSYLIKIANSTNPNMGHNQPPCIGSAAPVRSIDCTHTVAHENLCSNQNDIVWAVQQSTDEQPAAYECPQQASQYV